MYFERTLELKVGSGTTQESQLYLELIFIVVVLLNEKKNLVEEIETTKSETQSLL